VPARRTQAALAVLLVAAAGATACGSASTDARNPGPNRVTPTSVVSLAGGTHSRKLSGFRVLDVSFVDARNGYALGRFFGTEAQPVDPPVMVLMRTSDGGRSWVTVGAPPEAVEHVVFSNPRLGWAFGPNAFLTRDAAGSWVATHPDTTRRARARAARRDGVTGMPSSARLPASRSRWAEVQFVDPRHGWAASGRDVYRTIDGGLRWAAVRLKPSACGCVHRVDGR
jgi:hypothetical protein